VKYKLGFYIPEDDILHSHCRENLKTYKLFMVFFILLGAISAEPCLLSVTSLSLPPPRRITPPLALLPFYSLCIIISIRYEMALNCRMTGEK
jgi:hypothetical protein